MPEQGNAFGEALRKARRRAKRTLAEVAGELSSSVAYLSDIERGKRNTPHDHIIQRIARFLGCDELPLLVAADVQRGTTSVAGLSHEQVARVRSLIAALRREGR